MESHFSGKIKLKEEESNLGEGEVPRDSLGNAMLMMQLKELQAITKHKQKDEKYFNQMGEGRFSRTK
jgi:hypothetical protein